MNSNMNIMMIMMKFFSVFWRMPCFFKEVTHLYCPACGGTRAVKALLRLDLKASLFCNPIVLYGVLMCLWSAVWFMIWKFSGRKVQTFQPGLWMLYAGFVLFFGFDVIRNIGVYQFGYDYLGDLLL